MIASSMSFLPFITLVIVLFVIRQQAEQRRRLLLKVDELTHQVRRLALQERQRNAIATGKMAKPGIICSSSCIEPGISCDAACLSKFSRR